MAGVEYRGASHGICARSGRVMRAVGALAAGVAPRDETREIPPPTAATLPARRRCWQSPPRLAMILDAATAAIFAFFLLGGDHSYHWATA